MSGLLLITVACLLVISFCVGWILGAEEAHERSKKYQNWWEGQ